jgi:hypothetical protein
MHSDSTRNTMPAPRSVSLVVGSCFALLVGCSAVELPPPAAPAAEMPRVEASYGALPSNRSWVVLDTPNDRARVVQVTGTTVETDSEGMSYDVPVTREVCITPCVHDFRVGTRELTFQSLSNRDRNGSINLVVTKDPIVARFVMGETMNRHLAPWIVTLSVGGALLVASQTILTVGDAERDQPMVDVGFVTLGTGLGLLATTLVLGYVLRGQHVPGALTVFPLPRQTAKAAPSPGVQPFALQF